MKILDSLSALAVTELGIDVRSVSPNPRWVEPLFAGVLFCVIATFTTEKIRVEPASPPPTIPTAEESLEGSRTEGAHDVNGLSFQDLRCLAINAYFEARGEGDTGIRATMYVVLNRVESNRFPNTVCEVVYQDSQFSWTLDKASTYGNLNNAAKSVVSSIWRIARTLKLDDDVTKGSTHYHTVTIMPYWMARMRPTAVIGNHIFYRER